MSGEQNLRAMFERADRVDRHEGLLAYRRYNQVIRDLSDMYGVPIERVAGIFCALSPNNDYAGNLRSCVSVLHGYVQGWTVGEIGVSTYRHCLLRAYRYVTGESVFLDEAKGLKIRSFYMNVLYPEDNRFVTVDGHMVATYRGKNLTMKQAIPKGAREYREIEHATKRLAFAGYMLPNQYQAVVWFVRKRVLNIKAETQYDFLVPSDDVWKTYRNVADIRPFPRRSCPSSGN